MSCPSWSSAGWDGTLAGASAPRQEVCEGFTRGRETVALGAAWAYGQQRRGSVGSQRQAVQQARTAELLRTSLPVPRVCRLEGAEARPSEVSEYETVLVDANAKHL